MGSEPLINRTQKCLNVHSSRFSNTKTTFLHTSSPTKKNPQYNNALGILNCVHWLIEIFTALF